VAFSVNPVNGRRDEILVSAVRGMGERLVSGEASPDKWIVSNGNVVCAQAPEQAVDERQVRDIAEMARHAEAHFGSPRDVEWAISDGKLYLLQSRPITTLPEPAITPVPVPAEPPPGFRPKFNLPELAKTSQNPLEILEERYARGKLTRA
jgi:rifampicin phosphotransferase